MSKIKLFCLPYGGGSATVYLKWQKYLDRSIEIVPVELSGRGKRFNEGFYSSFTQAVDDAYHSVRGQLDTGKFAFFGHSLGSWLAYELGHQIKKKDGLDPVHIFFSGKEAPHIQKAEKLLHTLPEAEFCAVIYQLGGTPRELFEQREFLDVYIPILRADYRIVETYRYTERNSRLNCNITVFNGTEDDITAQELMEWQRHTYGRFELRNFRGGHFFIHDHVGKLAQIINATLAEPGIK
jgi:medium-chain acyl-[acyl-carrier-protein] hydrolase